MENDVRERIKLVLKTNKMSVNKLSTLSGVCYGTLSGQVVNDTTISLPVLLAILDVFPSVSTEWLLKGSGSMYTKSGSSVTTINNAHTHTGNASAGCQAAGDQSALIAEKDKRIEELTKDKENLMALLTNITKR